MSAVEPVPSSGEVDVDAFAFNLVLTKVFQDMLKKPDMDDGSEESQSAGVANEINKSIASGMAQGITGFGL